MLEFFLTIFTTLTPHCSVRCSEIATMNIKIMVLLTSINTLAACKSSNVSRRVLISSRTVWTSLWFIRDSMTFRRASSISQTSNASRHCTSNVFIVFRWYLFVCYVWTVMFSKFGLFFFAHFHDQLCEVALCFGRFHYWCIVPCVLYIFPDLLTHKDFACHRHRM